MKKIHIVIIVLLIIAVFFYFKNKKDAEKLVAEKYPDLTPEQWNNFQLFFGRGIVKPTKAEQEKYDYYLKKYGSTKNDTFNNLPNLHVIKSDASKTGRRYMQNLLPTELKLKKNSMKVAANFNWNNFYEEWLMGHGFSDKLNMFTGSFQ
jgi:hypothetical protein